MFNKLKQFKDLRNQAKQMQSALSEETSEGSGGWGKVKITMDGNMEIKKIDIDDDIMDNKQKLADAFKDAHKEAMKKIQKVMAKKMQEMGGLGNFPGMG
ncbi:YbaB/EbfC family nucleoid-associated protein [Patescibacteria group bacterium]